MNRTRSKILRKAARIMAERTSQLKRSGDGSLRYPPHCARRIYQELKKKCDPEYYKQLELIVKLDGISHKAEEATSTLQVLGTTIKRSGDIFLHNVITRLKTSQEENLEKP